jgi:hypothetical protein
MCFTCQYGFILHSFPVNDRLSISNHGTIEQGGGGGDARDASHGCPKRGAFRIGQKQVAMPVIVVVTHHDRPLAFIEFVDEAKYCRDTPVGWISGTKRRFGRSDPALAVAARWANLVDSSAGDRMSRIESALQHELYLLIQ